MERTTFANSFGTIGGSKNRKTEKKVNVWRRQCTRSYVIWLIKSKVSEYSSGEINCVLCLDRNVKKCFVAWIHLTCRVAIIISLTYFHYFSIFIFFFGYKSRSSSPTHQLQSSTSAVEVYKTTFTMMNHFYYLLVVTPVHKIMGTDEWSEVLCLFCLSIFVSRTEKDSSTT